MNAMTEERAIFENDEWLVSELGLEHKHTGYFIERDGVANRRGDGLWTWPMHMSEKTWCGMPCFIEAFLEATSAYRIDTGDLAHTFRIARGDAAEPARQNVFAAPLPVLRKGGGATMSSEPIFFKNPLPEKGFAVSPDARHVRFRTARYPVSAPVRPRGLALDWVKSALSWRAQHRIRRTGSTLVRLIQVAWNIR